MKTDKINEIIRTNTDLNQMTKNVMLGFIARCAERDEQRQYDRQLINEVTRENKLDEVILSANDVKIYTVSGNDEWDIKYPYRSIYLNTKDNKWHACHTVSPTLDMAYLVYLQNKHLGANSQFVDFAIKMLEMPKLEA